MLRIKHIITLCFLLFAFCINLSAHTEYVDSMFRVSIKDEQIKDSTLADRLNYNLFKAKEYQFKGMHEEALLLLNTNLKLGLDTIDYPKHICGTSAYLAYSSYYKLEKYPNALSAINLANKIDPDNTLYLKHLAIMRQGYQQYDEAIELFKKLNKLEPYNSKNIYNLCNLYIHIQQFNKALKELNKYEKLEGESLETLALRASIFKQSDKTSKIEKLIVNYIDKHPEEHYEASFILNNFYLGEQDIEKSFVLLNNLNKQYPNDVNILLALAEYYKKTDNEPLHEQYTFNAIKTTDIPAANAIKLARPFISGYLQNSDTANIQSTINQLNSIYPNNIHLLELKADIYKAQRDTAHWIDALYEIRKIKTDESIDLQLITLIDITGNKTDLIQFAKEGYQKFQKDHWAYYYLLSFIRNEMTDTFLTESFNILPNIITPRFKSLIYQIIGDTYSTLSNDSLAMQMYDSCLVYDPNNSGVLNNMAYNITKMPNPDLKKAEKMAAKALELDPESTYILDTYAWILFLQGDNFLSEFYFEKLLRIEKSNNQEHSIETLYHIGCLYLKTNRIDQAKIMWQQALDIYNNNPESFKEKNIIESIKQFLNDNE